MKVNKIKHLVNFAVSSKNSKNKKLTLSKINKMESNKIKLKTGLNVYGYKRILDKSGINHTLKKHGNSKNERKRGQIAVTKKDFELIPKIVCTENIIYAGKDKLGNDCILYEATIKNTYYYVEEIRKGRKELCIKSMRKRKPTTGK